MKNKIIGLKLEEIIKFDSKKFKSCMVRYSGECGGNAFEKELSIQEVLALYKSQFNKKMFNDKDYSLLENPRLKELVCLHPLGPYANLDAKLFSEYDLVRI